MEKRWLRDIRVGEECVCESSWKLLTESGVKEATQGALLILDRLVVYQGKIHQDGAAGVIR